MKAFILTCEDQFQASTLLCGIFTSLKKAVGAMKEDGKTNVEEYVNMDEYTITSETFPERGFAYRTYSKKGDEAEDIIYNISRVEEMNELLDAHDQIEL